MNRKLLDPRFVLLLICSLAGPVEGLPQEQPRLDLKRLEERADERVTISLDKDLLALAAKFLPQDDEDTPKVRALVKSLDSIWVRTFKFDRDQGYSPADVENLRKQLGADWSRMVEVRGKESVDFYVKKAGEKLQGFTIIAAEPRELTIITIHGNLRPEQLSELEGFAGIPRGLWSRDKGKPEPDKPKSN